MIEITVTGRINAFKECQNDTEAYLFLHDIKERYDALVWKHVKDMPMAKPERYIYGCSPDTTNDNPQWKSAVYQQQLRYRIKDFSLKVEIIHVDDMDDLL